MPLSRRGQRPHSAANHDVGGNETANDLINTSAAAPKTDAEPHTHEGEPNLQQATR